MTMSPSLPPLPGNPVKLKKNKPGSPKKLAPNISKISQDSIIIAKKKIWIPKFIKTVWLGFFQIYFWIGNIWICIYNTYPTVLLKRQGRLLANRLNVTLLKQATREWTTSAEAAVGDNSHLHIHLSINLKIYPALSWKWTVGNNRLRGTDNRSR